MKGKESDSAKTKPSLRGINGRGSVMSKDASKNSISPPKKRATIATDSKGNIQTNSNAGDGDEEDSPNKSNREAQSPAARGKRSDARVS